MRSIPGQSKHSGSAEGFTLVELMIVVVIGLVVMGSVLGLFWTFFLNYEQNMDYTTARQRGQMVFSIMNRPVLASGLGMPYETGEFKNVFQEHLHLKDWDGPLVISPDSDGNPSRDLYAAYALPSGIGVVEEVEFTSTSDFDVEVSTFDSAIASGDWISLPSASTSFTVEDFTDSPPQITLDAEVSGTVPLYDEIHHTRAALFTLEDSSFRAINRIEPGVLGEVSGIGDVFYEWDEDDRILTAYVLARGQTRKDEFITPAALDEWPDEAEPISDENRHYRLTVLRSSWRVRN